MRFVTRWKKKRSKIKLFWHETWFGLQKSWKVGKINGGVWNYIELSTIQDQSQHSSLFCLDLVREWRFVVKTLQSQIFAIPDFLIYKGCITAAKVLVSPRQSI